MLPRIPGRGIATGEEALLLLSRSNSLMNGVHTINNSDSPPNAAPRLSYGTHSHTSPDSLSTHQQQETETDAEVENDVENSGTAVDAENGTVAVLTRRLRCLFGIITWPIVPLGTLAVLALLWFLYAFLLDFNKTCSQPLKAYTATTLFWVVYIPSHTTVRSRLFSYVRERDGPNRPPLVRRYDQIFHTLLYVYAGITLVQSCRDDTHAQLLQEGAVQQQNTASDAEMTSEGPDDTCDSTCPNLFPALAIYVTTLEVFTMSLILPLLFLPCIYLWFLRQVADRDVAILQERFREEEENMLSGSPAVTAEDIVDQLESVKLLRKDVGKDEDEEIYVVPEDATSLSQGEDANGVRDCCICMNDFIIHDEAALHNHDVEAGEPSDDEEAVVRTRACGHLFHRRCMASWVGGQWQGRNGTDEDSAWRRRRAKRASCPLCRSDLRPSA
jgi:hypothetical protein